jgi:DNA ligase (NAD+)
MWSPSRPTSEVAGKTVVFTGSARKADAIGEAKAMAERLGAKVAGSVIGQEHRHPGRRSRAPGSKLKTAEALGVEVISEDEWFVRVGK